MWCSLTRSSVLPLKTTPSGMRSTVRSWSRWPAITTGRCDISSFYKRSPSGSLIYLSTSIQTLTSRVLLWKREQFSERCGSVCQVQHWTGVAAALALLWSVSSQPVSPEARTEVSGVASQRSPGLRLSAASAELHEVRRAHRTRLTQNMTLVCTYGAWHAATFTQRSAVVEEGRFMLW